MFPDVTGWLPYRHRLTSPQVWPTAAVSWCSGRNGSEQQQPLQPLRSSAISLVELVGDLRGNLSLVRGSLEGHQAQTLGQIADPQLCDQEMSFPLTGG
ncbi:hypothetical protein VZT92_011345 [Zoarces viviparus]